MLLMPDASSARMDPFTDEPVLNITCDVYEPMDGKPYDRDPRSIAKRAETYLKSTGLGDVSYFGPEPEFFIFDGVTWNIDMSGCFVKIKSEEAPWSSGIDYESGNMGFRAAGAARRLDADPQVHRVERRALVRQDRDLHAEARRRRQRLGHACAPVGVERRQEPLR